MPIARGRLPQGGPQGDRDQQRADPYRACQTLPGGRRRDCLSEKRPVLRPPSRREWVGGVRGVSSWRTSWGDKAAGIDAKHSPSSQRASTHPLARRPGLAAMAPLSRFSRCPPSLGTLSIFFTTKTTLCSVLRKKDLER